VPNGRAKTPDWDAAVAFRWHHGNGRVRIEPIMHRAPIRLRDLLGIDVQKEALERNTRQFLHGLPANNALLWGPRGTGKSSLIKALLNEYHADGLRLIEVDRHDLIGIHEIASVIADRPERFILFCDDLSFDEHDSSYKALKAAVDGGVFSPPDNLLIYATSNRRHLLPEMKRENLDSRTVDGEIHYAEAIEEKISLSERFGVWLAFHPFKQEDYLAIVHHWLKELSAPDADGAAVREAALQWALLHGSRSGRSAWQFAKDWAGSRALQNMAARYRTLGNGDIR
jgi:predicted AAA+ superfamily ATPase